jgi:hypothetical protein
MNDIFKKALYTSIYYIIVGLITYGSFSVDKVANGGPNASVFLLIGFILFSILIFIYDIITFFKGKNSKIGSITIHIIVLIMFYFFKY